MLEVSQKAVIVPIVGVIFLWNVMPAQCTLHSSMSPVYVYLRSRPIRVTRKSRYRRDDRAMRPIYECPENCMYCKRKISRRLHKNRHITILLLFGAEMSRCTRSPVCWASTSAWALIIWPWNYFSTIPTYVITVPKRHWQTDRRRAISLLRSALASRSKKHAGCTT